MEPEVRMVFYAAEGKWTYIVSRTEATRIRDDWIDVNGIQNLDIDEARLDQIERVGVEVVIRKDVVQAIEIIRL